MAGRRRARGHPSRPGKGRGPRRASTLPRLLDELADRLDALHPYDGKPFFKLPDEAQDNILRWQHEADVLALRIARCIGRAATGWPLTGRQIARDVLRRLGMRQSPSPKAQELFEYVARRVENLRALGDKDFVRRMKGLETGVRRPTGKRELTLWDEIDQRRRAGQTWETIRRDLIAAKHLHPRTSRQSFEKLCKTLFRIDPMRVRAVFQLRGTRQPIVREARVEGLFRPGKASRQK